MPHSRPRVLGELIVAMGGGRRTAADVVDPAVFWRFFRGGQVIGAGDVWRSSTHAPSQQPTSREDVVSAHVDHAWAAHRSRSRFYLERITHDHPHPTEIQHGSIDRSARPARLFAW